jgi:hypothetical protein
VTQAGRLYRLNAAVSRDGTELAVICTSDTQTAKLELHPLTGGVAVPGRALVDACLCASPSW